jgi:hypothetical protein
MCLTLKSKRTLPRISFRDKVVYKLLVPDSQLKDVYRTPFYNSLIEIGQTVESKLIKKGNYVNEGIHSMISLEQVMTSFYMGATADYIIVKCIVPKFTMYYLGDFRGTSIASKKLIYKEIVYDSRCN